MQNLRCISEPIYDGRENIIDWVLLNDGQPITDLSAVTRVTLTIGSTLIDSLVVGTEVIWWTDQEDILWEGQTITTDVLKLRLGGQGIPLGTYNGCVLNVYEPAAPNGNLWSKTVSVIVSEGE